MRRVGLILVLIGLTASGCLGSGSATPASTATQVIVPKVTPIYVQDAESAIRAVGLRVEIAAILPITDADASLNGFAIRGQSPAAGRHVTTGTVVVLRLLYSLNGGPGGVGKPGVVPNLIGMSINNAIAAATHVGLHVTVPAVNHPVASDSVTSQSLPAGSRVESDSVITLAVG
jgi:beta-lactam-binding protein with PASTA domain